MSVSEPGRRMSDDEGDAMKRARRIAPWIVAASYLVAPSIEAARFTVDATADDVDALPGDGRCETAAFACTLRAAVQEANAWAGPDEIVVPAGTYALTRGDAVDENAAFSGDLDVTEDLLVSGAGADRSVHTSPTSRLWQVRGGASLELVGLGLRPTAGREGTAVSVVSGSAALRRCAVDASVGPAIVSDDALELDRSSVGGAARPAVEIRGGSALFRNSTVSSPLESPSPSVRHAAGMLRIESSTLVGADIMLETPGAELVSSSSIIIGGEPTCVSEAPWTSLGQDVLGPGCEVPPDAEGISFVEPGDPFILAPPRADDPMGLRFPYSTSPATDGGDPAPPGSGGSACPDVDQRDAERVGRCDAGAVELDALADGRVSIDCEPGPVPVRVADVSCTFSLLNAGDDEIQQARLFLDETNAWWDRYDAGGADCAYVPDPLTSREFFLQCDGGPLGPGEALTVTAVLAGSQAGTVEVTARGAMTARDATPEDLEAEATVEISDELTTDMTLEVIGWQDPIGLGEEVNHEVRPLWIDGCGGVVGELTLVVPPQLEFVAVDGWDCDATDLPRVTCFVRADPFWPEGTVTLLTTRGAAPGEARLEATVRPTEARELDPSNNTVFEVTTVVAPPADIAVAATATPAPVTVGSVLTHELTVTSGPDDDAHLVNLEAAFPASALVADVDPSQGACSVLADRVECRLGTILASGTATVRLDLIPAEVGDLTTDIVASHSGTESNPGDETASVTTSVVAGGPLPPAPVGATIVVSKGPGGEAVLSWAESPIDGAHDAAEMYRAWVARRGCGAFLLEGSVAAPTTEWTDASPGRLRLYRIGATNAGGVSATPLPSGEDCR